MALAPDNPTTESPEVSVSSNDPALNSIDNPDESFIPGDLTAFDYSPEPFADLTEPEKGKLYELVILASRTDVASRRFEVEQAWEARLFERGYQHLLPRRGGGWSLPGENSQWGPLSTADSSALYSTNIYGRDKDIIVAAISRETPKINFFPNDPKNPSDVMTSEQANRYKEVYAKNNNLRERLSEMAYYYYTDDRCVLYTRLVADAQRFGFDGVGMPRMQEITTVLGKLECKVPMQAQCQSEMHFAQLYSEIDVNTAKCRYPWIAKKIKPGSCGIGEIELDKIARVNTKLALLGSYVTGDAMMREVTEQYTWLRPEMFYDEAIDEAMRDRFLSLFPKGCLVVCAGQVLAFARNESMDDHLKISHCSPGIGQNRRALGTNSISIQKRLNAYLDIMDDFHKRTIPRRLYHADAFDLQAMKQQDNIAGGSFSVLPQPGIASIKDLMTVEETPQPQQSLPEFCKMFFQDFPASLSGAVPSLFGGDTNTDTVGGITIQRDQALARIGIPWSAAHVAICEAARQAVIAAATRPDVISESLPSGKAIELNPDDLKGSIVCYPEYDATFPESWSERETRYVEIINQAAANPFYARLLSDTSNMRAVAENVRMADLKIPGEDSVKKQLIELDQLKQSGPVPNPEYVMLENAIAQFKAGRDADILNGTPIPPEADQMFQILEQQLQSVPPELSSIQPVEDQSENHALEAQVCFDWLNGEEGLKFKYGTFEQQQAFHNIYLHWQAHSKLADKFKPGPNVQPKAPSITFKGEDLPPDAQAQALREAGIVSTPQAQSQAKLISTQHKIAEKVAPKTVPTTENINTSRMKRQSAGAPPNGAKNGPPNRPSSPPR